MKHGGGLRKMARFVGIDVSSDVITLTIEYSAEKEEKMMKLAKKRLGENIDFNELKELCPEIDYFQKLES